MTNKRNPKVIHETVLRDIVTIISSGLKREDDYEDIKLWGSGAKHSFRSLTKATSNLILTFPILVSSNVSLSSAIMLCKSHERKCAAMMHMLFSALSYSSDSENVYDYLKQFHKNIDFDEGDLNIDNLNDTMDDIADDIADESAKLINSPRFNYEVVQEFKADMKNINYPYIEESFNPSIGSNYDSKVLLEAQIPKSEWNRLVEAIGRGEDVSNDPFYLQLNLQQTRSIQKAGGRFNKNSRDNLENQLNLAKRQGKTNIDIKRVENPWQKNYADKMAGMEKATAIQRDPWVKTDMQKANELLPTMLVVNFYSPHLNEPITATIGIKAKVYQIESDQILSRLLVRNRDNQGFHNFLRAATREISFIKDFALAVDKAKIDALSSSNRGSDSKIWKLLERRAIKSKIRRGLGMKNDATAITTIAITQSEVDTMKKEYGTDIDRIPVLKPIMDAYNLMGFVIIDSDIECMKFLYDDGSNNFDVLSFSSLERDSKDSDYKKVINLMTKMAR